VVLGVSYDVAKVKTARNIGGYYRQEWLYDLFKRHRQTGMLDCGARAYIMLLVGYTIFADKSFSLDCGARVYMMLLSGYTIFDTT